MELEKYLLLPSIQPIPFLLCFQGLMQKLSDVQAKKVEAAVVEARNGVCSPLVRLLSACVCLECETD